MIPTQTLESFPVFGSNATKVEPGDAKKAAGWQQADVVPAEWMNWEWYKASKGITELNAGVSSIEAEINYLLTQKSITPAQGNSTQLLEALNKIKAEAILAAHPVGSLYWTASTENPATTFGGGTWTQIKDKFILAAGDTYSNGATGGFATVTLTTTQIPSHNHSGTTEANNRGHVHEFKPTGIIGSSPDATDFQTSGMSAHTTGWVEVRPATYDTLVQSDGSTFVQAFTSENRDYMSTAAAQKKSQKLTINIEHEHAAYFTGNTNDTKGESQNHTHNYTTNSAYGNPDDSGKALAHENMPPYIVKYCWQRTA